MAAFFFIDIVGLSDPILSTETQRKKIISLNSLIGDCETFSQTPKSDLFILPTGDGMLVGFKDGLEQPISLAIELHAKLKEYNQHVSDTEKITTRIGCNIGHIFFVKDLFDNVNLWGPGAILSRRVMDLGNENHILLPSNMVDDLFEISDEYEKIFPSNYCSNCSWSNICICFVTIVDSVKYGEMAYTAPIPTTITAIIASKDFPMIASRCFGI